MSGGSQASSICAKGHPNREIKLQKTPIDGTEHGEGEVDAQGTRGSENNTRPTTQDRQRTGPSVKAGRGGGVGCVDDGDR